ncbi:aminotransferase class I/II-fold pyridoxal phosphate-dependent enzyme [Lysinibacillus xylanilyticus]|uniref:aminotransferase class I/II-fold pyridoxal phosphate-dependent enzyme n=1 Tax=Lysinibacillus xylanilyticus TaxID=582475 RepID=UPI002B2464C1|nr:aminotransferase class I/II-fold pyridoxal phosphate-dependent enzyme [Lysinibacillus xylanilyticus]MEB2298027.1 aminotransferase class I/II-fold pyridoxal phosphate-dependent enzyme [Lysinibacillus xylanilyticus]
MNNRILLSSPHMGGTEQKYIQEAFDTNWIAPLGSNVNGFEQELADYVGVKAASATSAGTAAIHLALDLLGVRAGDPVFCSTLTFIASANPILYLGAKPVFIDSEETTWNMSPQALECAFVDAKRNGQLPKAVIIVNLYGQSAQMDELMAICDTYGVPIVEDAAESLGSTYKGKKSGTFGKFGIYSFNGNKIITTSGGGMLVSNDEELISRSRFLATQARDMAKHYQHSVVGYNYRMSNIVAGIGRGQLEVLDERVAQKRDIFERYAEAFLQVEGIQMMPELDGTFSNRWLSTMTIDPNLIQQTPYEIIDALNDANVEARPVWKPLHMQPLFADCPFYVHEENNIVSERLFATGICLPSDTKMTLEEQQRVIDVVLENCRAVSAV